MAMAAPATVKRKATQGKSLRGRLSRSADPCLRASKKGLSRLIRPSISTYFLWSCGLYLFGGISLVFLRSHAEEFLCAIPPQAELGGIGCDSTSSKFLLCSKPACWRSANNVTYKLNASLPVQNLYEDFSNTTTDIACSAVVSEGSVADPISMVLTLSSASGAGASCKKYHCGVLANALTMGDLSSPSGDCGTDLLQYSGFNVGELAASSSPNSTDMKSIESVCGSDIISAMHGMCAGSGNPPRWCGLTTTATTATTTTTGTVTTTGLGRRLIAQGARPLLGNVTLRTGRHQQGHDIQEGSRRSRVPSGEARQLQTSTAVSNDDLPDWQAGEWSQCSCYQQCTPGMRTRLVDCLSTECKMPMPADREPCSCGNGAACTVDVQLVVMMSVYFVQAGLALALFLCYLRTLYHSEDDFIHLSFKQRISGFFYKQLPPVLRLLVLVQLFQVVYLAVDVWIAYLVSQYMDASSTWQKDCFASKALQNMSELSAFLWVCGVVLGRCTKRSSRKPDWLYSPDRPARGFPLRQIRRCFRCLGP